MTTPFDSSRTPTPLPPAPRAIRTRPGLGFGNLFPRLFILPHASIGVGTVFYLLFLLLAVPLSSVVPGKVVATSTSRSKNTTTYMADYRYTVNGISYEDSESMDIERYQQWSTDGVEFTPIPVTISHFAIGPLRTSRINDLGSPWPQIGFMLFFSAFWNGVVFIFVYLLWIVPLRRRLLARYGTPVAGRITGTRISSGKNSSTFYVAYAFPDPGTLRPLAGESQVPTRDLWQQAVVGQPVTVLVHPRNPKRSLAYEFSPYILKDSAATLLAPRS